MNNENKIFDSLKPTSDVERHDPVKDLMLESELIEYLRISEISKSKNFSNVIENLKRFRGLPRLSLCNKTVFPKESIKEWIKGESKKN